MGESLVHQKNVNRALPANNEDGNLKQNEEREEVHLHWDNWPREMVENGNRDLKNKHYSNASKIFSTLLELLYWD